MRFLFDQNISHRILSLLPEQFSGSTSVKKEGLINAYDKHIWDYARLNNYMIVTQDSDFNDLSTLLGFPPKIIWIRTGNLTTKAILDILIDNYYNQQNFESDHELNTFKIKKL